MKFLFGLLFLLLFPLPSHGEVGPRFDFSLLRRIPIQDQGRVKPLDTFARESVQTITGKTYFHGQDPLQTLLEWIVDPKQAIHAPILLARFEPLNRKVGIVAQHGYISPDQLSHLPEFQLYLKTIMLKQQEEEPLNATDKEASQLYGRLELLQRVISGEVFVLFPEPPSETWVGPIALKDGKSADLFNGLLTAFKNRAPAAFLASSRSLKDSLREMGKNVSNYPSEGRMDLEVTFNRIRPFQKAWIFSLSAFVLVLLSFLRGEGARWLYRLAVVLAVFGVLMSVYGFVSRCLIAGRPPVSNMYESVIWVSFGALTFALIFEAIYRSRYFLLSGAAGATLGLVLADSLPNVLSANINPLVPVLRSNYWLTIHVLTITLSYAAFLLATGVAQVAVGFYAFRPQEKDRIKSLNLFLYRAMQVGVILLAAGTILGGVWANYSWGRFWGWDPKEVWALIALLGYVAILHGRFAGWLRDFGMAVWSVLAFLLVLMAWYGVNFVLGVGLHSYGFSSGGFSWVMSFVAIQLAWVIFATVKYKKIALAGKSAA